MVDGISITKCFEQTNVRSNRASVTMTCLLTANAAFLHAAYVYHLLSQE